MTFGCKKKTSMLNDGLTSNRKLSDLENDFSNMAIVLSNVPKRDEVK